MGEGKMYYSGIVKVLPPPNFIPALYKVLAEIQDTGTIECHMDVVPWHTGSTE